MSYIVWIVVMSITVVLDFKEIIYTYFPLRVLTTILIYFIGYQSIIQLRLLKERKNIRKQLGYQKENPEKLKIVEEKDEEKKILFEKLNTLLQEQKLFTAPKLNVELLANELDISVHKLSNTIKLFSEKNFNDFINDFRIALSKELLIDKAYKNYTITSIGLESGFNSKSTFYATFKKQTGFTPSQYQQKFLILDN